MLRLVLLLLLVGTAGAAVTLSLIPYETLRDRLNESAVDGDAGLTRARHATLVLQLRLAAGALSLAAAALWLGRAQFDAAVSRFGRSCRRTAIVLRTAVAGEARRDLAGVAALMAIGSALRIRFLDVPLRYDEATTYVNFASEPLHVALTNYATPNNHVLHTLLVGLTTRVLGDAEWAIRLPALTAGVLAIPAAYMLGRVVHGRTAGLLLGALVATSSTLVEYSTNARGYTIVVLLTLVLFAAAPWVAENDEPAGWAALALLGALGAFAVPVMLYPFGGALLLLALEARRQRAEARRRMRRVVATGVGAAVVALLLYAPAIAASGVGALVSNEYVAPRDFDAFAAELGEALRDTVAAWWRDLGWGAHLLTLAAFAGLVAHRRLSRFAVPPVLPTLVWTTAVVVAQRAAPFPRVLLFLLPLCLLPAAGAGAAVVDHLAVRLGRRWAAPALAIALSVVTGVAVATSQSVRDSRETGGLPDAPAVAQQLAEQLRPGDAIVATGSDTILGYYLGRRGIDAAGALLHGPRGDGRLLLVVNVAGGQTLASLADDPRIRPAELRRARLKWTSVSALVYVTPRAD